MLRQQRLVRAFARLAAEKKPAKPVKNAAADSGSAKKGPTTQSDKLNELYMACVEAKPIPVCVARAVWRVVAAVAPLWHNAV